MIKIEIIVMLMKKPSFVFCESQNLLKLANATNSPAKDWNFGPTLHSYMIETTLWNIENELIYFRYKECIIFYGTYSRNCKKQSWTSYLCNHVLMFMCMYYALYNVYIMTIL